MSIHRFAFLAVALTMVSCDGRPTIVGARTSQRVADTDRHVSVSTKAPSAAPIDGADAIEPIAPPAGFNSDLSGAHGRFDVAADEEGSAAAVGDHLPREVANGEEGGHAEVDAPADAAPAGPAGPTSSPNSPTDNSGDAEAAAPAEVLACVGQAVSCARLNDYPTWATHCVQQSGCNIAQTCVVVDKLLCDGLPASECEARGCQWQMPPAVETVQARQKWWNWSRWLNLASLIGPDDSVTVLKGYEPSWLGNTSATATAGQAEAKRAQGASQQSAGEAAATGFCLAPEAVEVQAVCAGLQTAQACADKSALCSWHVHGCVGEAVGCSDLCDDAACYLQTGCSWSTPSGQ